MTNTAYQNACLKLDKWIDPPVLNAHKIPELSRDLLGVRKAITDLSEEVRRLKIGRTIKQREASQANLRKGRGSLVMGAPKEQAEAICGADGPVDVYRFASGAVTWRERGGKAPKGGEFIGTYDEGADYRQVLEDLQA